MHLRSRGLGLAVAMAVVVAACQSGGGASPTAAPPGSTAPSASADTSAAPPTGEPIVIGAAMALTGDFSPDTKLVRDGYQYAVDKINALGGVTVGGEQRPLELLIRDDGSDREVSARLLEQLIAEDEVDLLLAPWGSGNTNAVAPISERYERVMIAPLAASDAIWEQGYQYLFGMLPLGSDNMRPTVDMVDGLGLTKLAVITTDDLFPGLAADGARDQAAKDGLELVVDEIYPPGTLDVGPIITQLQDAAPEFVIAPVDVADAIVLVQQMKERGYQPPGLSFSGATFVPDFLTAVGDDAEGLMGVVHWFRTLPWSDETFGTAEEFATDFEATVGYAPTHDNAAAAAAVESLVTAVETADSLEQVAVRDALRGLDIETFFGPVNFDDTTGQNIGLEYPVQIVDGESVIVYPEDAASTAPAYPLSGWAN